MAARRERYWIHGDVVTVFAGSEDTGGTHCFFETRVDSPDSSGVRPHAHAWQDETTFVQSGRFEFTLDGERLLLGPGDLVRVPRGVVHTYRNVGPGEGRLWAALAPAGLERFFREFGVPIGDPLARELTSGAATEIPANALARYGILVARVSDPPIPRRLVAIWPSPARTHRARVEGLARRRPC